MINIFVIGEVNTNNITRFSRILQFYSTVDTKKFVFYFCLHDENLQLSEHKNIFHLVEKQKSIYCYIDIILKNHKFEDNDDIYLNPVGSILFLKDDVFNPIDKKCLNGRSYMNLVNNNIVEQEEVSEEHICEIGLEKFVEYNRMNLEQDLSFNGTYFKYSEIKKFMEEINKKMEDKNGWIASAWMGDDIVIYRYIGKANGFSVDQRFDNDYHPCDNPIVNGFIYIEMDQDPIVGLEFQNEHFYEGLDIFKNFIANSKKIVEESQKFREELEKNLVESKKVIEEADKLMEESKKNDEDTKKYIDELIKMNNKK